jgi:hypothetical protein
MSAAELLSRKTNADDAASNQDDDDAPGHRVSSDEAFLSDTNNMRSIIQQTV